jgi:MoaA/NifB/PqqE/SkfB family radical SAM enzyme
MKKNYMKEITERCNLSCNGYYAWAFNRKGTEELTPEKLKDIKAPF